MDPVSSNPETETGKQLVEREVPVTVSGRGVGVDAGESFTEQTVTKATFENGAVVRLSADVNEGQTLRVRNGENGREAEARVTKSLVSHSEPKYVELEFAQAEHDFWTTEEVKKQENKATEIPIEAPKLDSSLTVVEPAKQTETPNAEQQAEAEEVPAWLKVNKAWEGGDSYPIRMQLPKAGEASPRTAEFAADSATITAAQDEYLLPKPSLNFEQFSGLAQEKTKLLSGKARRSLSGPIGALVAVVLLLLAAGIGSYRLGWLKWTGGKVEKREEEPSARTGPASEVKTTGEYAVPLPKAENPPVNAAREAPATTNAATGDGGTARAAKSDKPRPGVNTSLSTPGAGNRNAAKSDTKDDSTHVTTQDGVYEPPRLIKAIRSLSPPEALQAYASGVVTLDALVDEGGKVLSATPTSGPKALYQKAAQTVREGYLYQPATRNGKPVQAHVEVRIQFWYEP